jgi:tetratricopeptide (TPR) repeat protein
MQAVPTRQIRSLWKPLIAIAVLFGLLALLQVRIDAQTRSEATQKQELLVTSGPLLKKLSLGYAPLLADVYWTRAVQYYGSRLGRPNVSFDLLSPLLNIAVTLDPHLIIAYRFGAIFLSMPRPGRTDLAIDLVKRGIAANPSEWRLDYDLGTIYYSRLKDYKHAAQAFLAASNISGAPLFLKPMAASMAQKGGSLEMSEMIFAELYRSTEDKNIRKWAVGQLQSLKAQQDEAQIDKLIEQYRTRFNKNPASMDDLVAAGLLRQNPLDPAGYPYVIGPDGNARLYPSSPIKPPKP